MMSLVLNNWAQRYKLPFALPRHMLKVISNLSSRTNLKIMALWISILTAAAPFSNIGYIVLAFLV